MNRPLRVLFICAMNLRRSLTAEHLYRRDPRVEVRSAGLRDGAKRRVSAKDVEWAEVVYVMEREHKTTLRERFPGVEFPDIEVLDVPDDFEYMDDALKEMLRGTLEPDIAARTSVIRDLPSD